MEDVTNQKYKRALRLAKWSIVAPIMTVSFAAFAFVAGPYLVSQHCNARLFCSGGFYLLYLINIAIGLGVVLGVILAMRAFSQAKTLIQNSEWMVAYALLGLALSKSEVGVFIFFWI